jgi:hypothetical protein
MVTLSVMVVFLTLSSCNSSVNPDQPKIIKELTCTLTLNETDKEALKKDDLSVKVKRGKEIKEDFHFNEKYTFKENDEIQIEVKKTLKEGEKFTLAVYLEDLSNPIVFGEAKDKSLSFKVDSKLLDVSDNLSGDKKFNILIRHTNNTTPNPGPDPSSMTILEFLDYKIGFDRNKKEKSDVIYGTDSIYKSDQLYKTNNLGFGKKAKDFGIYYHGLTGSSIKAMNVAEVEETSSSFKEKGVKTNFGSVYDGLEVRWKSAKACMSGKWNKYTDANYDNLFLCRPYLNDFKFLLYPDSKGYNLYIKINESSYDSYYMDFHIAFVKKDEPDKGYSVHFSNLNDKKDYEPYLLFDAGDARYKDYPPEAIPQYTDQKDGIHMFRLSSLLKTSLKHQREKESKKWKYSDEVLVNRLLEEVKSKNYDIYLILGHVSTNKTSGYEGFFSILRGRFWCNVLKFGDPIWAENQTQP